MLELDILVAVIGFNVVTVVGLLFVVNFVVVGLLVVVVNLLVVVVDFAVNVVDLMVGLGLYLIVVKCEVLVVLTGALVHSPYLTTETLLLSTLLSKLKVPELVLVLEEVPEFHQDFIYDS